MYGRSPYNVSKTTERYAHHDWLRLDCQFDAKSKVSKGDTGYFKQMKGIGHDSV